MKNLIKTTLMLAAMITIAWSAYHLISTLHVDGQWHVAINDFRNLTRW